MVNSNIFKRVVSSLAIGLLVLLAIFIDNIIFHIFISFVAIAMCIEWYELTIKNNNKKKFLWMILGILYIAAPCVSFSWLIEQKNGQLIILWIILVIAGTDIGGYFFGKTIGGAKLAPRISPNKTWIGLAGGMLIATIVGTIMNIYIAQNIIFMAVFSCLLAVLAQAGDLLESGIKRYFGIKDSGKIIPGHGGILDRVDGFILVAPLVALIIYLYGNIF